MKIRLILIILSFCIHTLSQAQDGHYWSENYGNRSMLLSGVVIAGVEDLGAVFYNPGRLGLIEKPAFAISANVYEWSNLSVEDGVMEGNDLKNSSFGGAPSLAAGTFSLPFMKEQKFAYSFLTRQRTKANFFVRVEDEGDVVAGLPGTEIFNGKINYSTDFNEEWYGLTWAPPAIKKFGMGLSTFVSNLHKSNSFGENLNALNEFNDVASYTVDRRYSYESFSVLWKLGMAVSLTKINLGLTITTPRINAYGKGSTHFEDYISGLNNFDDTYIYMEESNLKVKYKSPWAIGTGIGIPFKKLKIHISTEWYSKVNEYTILEMDPFIGQSSGDTIRFKLTDELNSVFNYGIGFEYHFNKKLSAYASFATDYSAVKSNIHRFVQVQEEASNSVFQADFFQFGGGFSIDTKAVEITLGATHEGASETFKRAINLPGDESDENATSTLVFSQWRFILGFSFPFADNIIKKVESDPEK